MQELDVIDISNPTSEDFSWKFNGQPFVIKAGEKRGFAKSVAIHLAKHLSTKMISDEALSKVKEKDLADPKNPIHTKVSQLHTYDTHERRIALFKILGDIDLVLEVITKYPFKGFIGEMSLYENFVGRERQSLKQEETEVKAE